MLYLHNALVRTLRNWNLAPFVFATWETVPAVFGQEPVPGSFLEDSIDTTPAGYAVVGPALDASSWLVQKNGEVGDAGTVGLYAEVRTQVRFYAPKTLYGADFTEDLALGWANVMHKQPGAIDWVPASTYDANVLDVIGSLSVHTDNYWGTQSNLRCVLRNTG